MRLWIDAAGPQQQFTVFGLPLVERHIRAARKSGASITEICVDTGTAQRAPLPQDLERSLPIVWRSLPGPAGERLARYAAEAGTTVVAVDAASVVDPRIYPILQDRQGGWVALGSEGVAVVSVDARAAAGLSASALRVDEVARGLLAAGSAREIGPADFPRFIRRLRRELPFFAFPIRSAADRDRTERFLFESNYKGSTDFLTKYVYPPLVWRMLRPLARARVHPNVVTGVSIVLTFAAVPFFAMGQFLIGLLLAYGMSVLDSVDGKLARVTFTDSRIGNWLDHGLDLLHPPLWYLAWGWGLAGGNPDDPVFVASQWLTLIYVLDRLVLAIYPRVYHRALHAHSPMDEFLRTFIGRRNVNLWIITIGVLTGTAVPLFYFIVFWQALTLAYHAGRTAWILLIERRRKAPVPGV